jgi:hypothetical protein
LVERGVGELPFVILRCCAAGKLVGAGVRHAPCRPGPRNQSHHGPTAASEAAGNGVFLGTDLEVIGGRPVLISQ